MRRKVPGRWLPFASTTLPCHVCACRQPSLKAAGHRRWSAGKGAGCHAWTEGEEVKEDNGRDFHQRAACVLEIMKE